MARVVDQAGEWPRETLERVEACPVCGVSERCLVHAGLTDRVYGRAPGRWSLFECGACSACYLDPRPTRGAIGDAYVDFYTHRSPIPGEPGRSRAAKLKLAIRNGYINRKARANLRPSVPWGAWVVPMFPGKKREIDFSIRGIPGIDRPGSRRLLDIGSGDGNFLRVASGMGWVATGIEPDDTAARYASERGFTTINRSFEDVQLREERFDLITLCHVIEHFHDPVAALRKVKDLLKPAGQIWIATPNMQAAGHRSFGADWIGLDPPRHLVLFNRKSLVEAFSRAGVAGDLRFLPGRSALGDTILSWRLAKGLRPFGPEPGLVPASLRMTALLADLLRRETEEELVLSVRTPA